MYGRFLTSLKVLTLSVRSHLLRFLRVYRNTTMREQPHFLPRLGRLVTTVLFVASVASASFLTIQPIQVCASSGASCANPTRELFEEAGDTIWAQAGIDLVFEPWNVYRSDAYLTIDNDGELGNLFYNYGTGADPDSTVISMWFVDALNLVPSGTVFGASLLNSNRIAIAQATFTQNRLDTIAHEIGHNLGLPHYTGTDAQLYLMADGSSRITPADISDIYPNAPYLDQLTPIEVDWVRLSPLLYDSGVPAGVPEPWSIMLTGGGLLALSFRMRKN